MSIKRKPRNGLTSGAPSRLRRRIVLELTVEELPLMEAAEARHGSKRGALLAALASQARVEELERQLTELERQLAAQTKQSDHATRAAADDTTALARELKSVKASLARAKRELAKSQAAAERSAQQLLEAQDEHQALIDAREQEIAELSGRAFHHLFCARCGEWASEEEWAWATADEGEYAYHQPCGDHGPSLLGGNPSWLGS